MGTYIDSDDEILVKQVDFKLTRRGRDNGLYNYFPEGNRAGSTADNCRWDYLDCHYFAC